MSLLTKIFGDANARVVKTLEPIVAQVNALEQKYRAFSDAELSGATAVLRERLVKGEALDALLPQAFAAVREAASRTLGQRHFDVQLLGGMVLHRGQIAEMRTGEGKTLTATLPMYLNALEGKGCHLVTVNDYLARRDAVWMGQIYHALGMTVGCIQHETSFRYDPTYQTQTKVEEQKPTEEERDKVRDTTGAFRVEYSYLRPVPRREAYGCDITYGTNNEFGFDYLRDNMAGAPVQEVQRGLHYAIVDEVDSILIDEARTPLIISAPDAESSDRYRQFAQIAGTLVENTDYNVDLKMRAATLTEVGITKVEKALGVSNLYAEGGMDLVHHIEQAVRAQSLYHLDKEYVVKDGEIIIVDEFTGRMMHGRRYSEGLHQAIEAKEGVKVQQESRTLATVTFQNLFRLYNKLAGMTGTAATEAEEFSKIYDLEVVTVPTNKPMVRGDLPDRIYKTEGGKYQAVVAEIKARHAKGQPVLVGTISIEKNELLGQLLAQSGIEAQLLNAKQHEKEGQIIAQAGRRGAVTIATNMAGRGVDIILGGNPPDAEEGKVVCELGGLHIIGTERHESRRIDNQLRGRAGRQGDPGSSQFFLSTEDDLMKIFGSDRIRGIMETLKIPEDMPIENRMVSRSLEAAQKKVEGHNFDLRKHLVEYDDVVNKHRELMYGRRKKILHGDNLRDDVLSLVAEEIAQFVGFHTAGENQQDWDLKEVAEVAKTIFPLPSDAVQQLELRRGKAGDKMADAEARTRVIDYLKELAVAHYDQLERAAEAATGDKLAMRKIEKAVMLRSMDTLWMDHLDSMDHLRTGIGLRGYGQLDPLVEYKRESYRMFTELTNIVNKQIVYSIYKVGVAGQMLMQQPRLGAMQFTAPSKEMQRGPSAVAAAASSNDDTPQAREVAKRETVSNVDDAQTHYEGTRVGRNDPCPCGAKKADGTPVKFKHCHGK
ncbi:MAG: preprotein translocase subunit SecA [Parcubacteria group bacterium Gr01-1014_31]|nr:MAG: preprotein translocase subunit SecA [Parcubacteria group bacterium Gr01-1014_31]